MRKAAESLERPWKRRFSLGAKVLETRAVTLRSPAMSASRCACRPSSPASSAAASAAFGCFPWRFKCLSHGFQLQNSVDATQKRALRSPISFSSASISTSSLAFVCLTVSSGLTRSENALRDQLSSRRNGLRKPAKA